MFQRVLKNDFVLNIILTKIDEQNREALLNYKQT